MDLNLPDKVYRKNLCAYKSLNLDFSNHTLSDLFFVSLPMFKSASSFERCLSSNWQFSEGVEISAFNSLCSILDKFNFDDFGFNLNNSDCSDLSLLRCVYSGVMSGQYSCNEFETDFRKIHEKFIKYKFRNSFCSDFEGKFKNVTLVQKLNLQDALKLSENSSMGIIYEKTQKVDNFISNLK